VTISSAPSDALKAVIAACIEKLLRDDLYLLQAGVHEQAITHRLAHYIQEQFPDQDVDAEYNRHGLAIKSARLRSGSKHVVPDIVVHARGNDHKNLLVIEVKIRDRGDAEDRDHAHQKLDALVHGGQFRYQFGLYLELGFDVGKAKGVVDQYVWYTR